MLARSLSTETRGISELRDIYVLSWKDFWEMLAKMANLLEAPYFRFDFL